MRIFAEFEKRYGFFGEGLETPEEKEDRSRTGACTVHFPSEISEYAGIEEKYREEEQRLEEYREG